MLKSTDKVVTTTGLNFNNFKREHIGKFDYDNTLNYNNDGYKYDVSAYNKTTINFGSFGVDGDIQIEMLNLNMLIHLLI